MIRIKGAASHAEGATGVETIVKRLSDLLKGDWVGVHFAVNIFIATSLLWLILRKAAGLDPIWAISSMIAASDPNVKQAMRTFRDASSTRRSAAARG